MIDPARFAACYRRIPWWLLLPILIAIGAGWILLGVELMPRVGTFVGTIIVFLAPLTLVSGLVSRILVDHHDWQATLNRDAEQGYVWSQRTDSHTIVWEHKQSANRPEQQLRGVRIVVALYASMTTMHHRRLRVDLRASSVRRNRTAQE